MECKTATKKFVCYRDGDLPTAERLELEEHLAECAACQKEWTDYTRTVDGISGLKNIAISDDFTSKVKQTIVKRSKGRFFGDSGGLSIRFAIISFVLILVFLLAYLFITTGRDIELVDIDEGKSAPGEPPEP